MEEEIAMMTTTDLLNLLPAHLHLARNPAADVNDRWRVYNIHSCGYSLPGFSSARELLEHLVKELGLLSPN